MARIPDNPIGNLVVAHRRSNGAKREFLAATSHVCGWVDRITTRDLTLARIAADLRQDRAEAWTIEGVRALYLRLPPRLPSGSRVAGSHRPTPSGSRTPSPGGARAV